MMTSPTKKRIRYGLFAVGWLLVICVTCVAFRCALHDWPVVDRTTTGMFIAGVACLWLGSEIEVSN